MTQASIYHKFILCSAEEPLNLRQSFSYFVTVSKMVLPPFCELFLLFLSYLTWAFCVYFAQQYSMKKFILFTIAFSKSLSVIESEYYSHHYSCIPVCVRFWQEIVWSNQNLYCHFVKLWLKTSSRKVICNDVFTRSNSFL